MKKILSVLLSMVMLLSVTAGLSFNVFAESYIDEVELYHIDLPVAGEKPNFMATQYDFDGAYASDLTECKINSTPYSEGIAWYDITDNSYINPADTSYRFKCGHGYQVFVLVEIKDTQGGQVKFADPSQMWARVTFGELSSGTPGQNTAVLPNPKAAPGEEDYSVAVCSEYYVPNHFFGDPAEYEVNWDENNDCTCTGVCKRCSQIVTETVTPVVDKVVPATCTEGEFTTLVAKFTKGFDDETFGYETSDPLGHDFSGGAATCKRCGVKGKKNTIYAKGKTAAVKYSKKKNRTIKRSKAITVKKAKGAVTYKKSKGNKKIKVAKNGKITVVKGLKKGTYKVKIKVKAAGEGLYKPATKTVTVKVVVK